jgi:sec-independent protein translocase protein TatB
MFDLDAGKILVVGVVALIVIGPKDLPRVLRTVGQTVGRMRRMAAEFQNQFAEAIKEADLEEVKKEFSALQESAKIDTSFDAASIMREEITTAVEGPKEIGHSTIDLAGEAGAGAAATAAKEAVAEDIAEKPSDQSVHEALALGPAPEPAAEKVAVAAHEDHSPHTGVDAREGDRVPQG